MDFQGRYLVSVSDADMLASAYVDGALGPREGEDALSVIPLQGDRSNWRANEVSVSNSVAGPPTAVAVSPDGKWAFVVETFGPRPNGGEQFGDLPIGNALTVVDLSNPRNPRIHQSIEIGERPEAVTVSPDGSAIAVTLHPPADRQVAIVPFDGGRLGEPAYFAIPQVAPAVRASHVEWHPSGEFLAATLVDAGQLVMLRVVRDRGELEIEPWGPPTFLGKYPFMGRFTPDGQYFIASNLYWGDDVAGFWIEAPRGDVVAVRIATAADADGNVRHPLVSRTTTGISPEGLAISPDGALVVTTNLERSYLPYDDDRITFYSSLTLVELDPETGQLSTVGDYAFDGILPEAAAFDASGNFLAVVNYDHFDDSIRGGSVDFWRVERRDGLQLVQTDYSIPVTRGAHSIVLVP
ncbi:beta-propeller fold lactonase family protein [Synechococcus sp. PCC 7336]|uniref:beta-propeller fold lactonase family protein n=1 Tax=Synechococcus sp. PCC 7336 TaxID=195250 RepID=UPI0003462881|nr:beta-propeller fold lactonase family protein [Synechococcus sp. PCC 7336]